MLDDSKSLASESTLIYDKGLDVLSAEDGTIGVHLYRDILVMHKYSDLVFVDLATRKCFQIIAVC